MGYAERNIWAQLVTSSIGAIVYVSIVLPQLQSRPLHEIDWVWPMIWTIVAAIVVSIVLSIVWGIVAGIADPEAEHEADQRDREIGHFGNRIGQALLIAGSLGALVLTMNQAHWFWIGNVLFLGFFLAATVGGISSLVAYRRGLH